MERPKRFDASFFRDNGGLDREGGEKLLAEMLRQRQGGMFGGHHPAMGRMGGHAPPFPGAHPMMMGGLPRHSVPPPMGPPPMGMMGMGGMGMGMHPYTGMGMGMGGIGMKPHIGMGGLGLGLGRPQPGHSPFGHQRHSPFGYASPGPPRAHSFPPQHRHAHSPFSRPRPSPFSTPRMMFEDDDFDDDYRMHISPRRGFGRPRRSSLRFAPPRQPPRRRSYHPPPSMFEFEESDDDYDDYDDYEDDYDDEDELEDYFPRRSPYMRIQRGY
jgi:hypothetical protein